MGVHRDFPSFLSIETIYLIAFYADVKKVIGNPLYIFLTNRYSLSIRIHTYVVRKSGGYTLSTIPQASLRYHKPLLNPVWKREMFTTRLYVAFPGLIKGFLLS